MIIDDLRTIRITIQSIREMTWGHKVRNKRLEVMCREIDVMLAQQTERIEVWMFSGQAGLREQLIDGIRALRALAHPGNERPGMAETNREVMDRLRLLEDLATFLIKKAEEIKPPLSAMDRALLVARNMLHDAQTPTDTDEVPF